VAPEPNSIGVLILHAISFGKAFSKGFQLVEDGAHAPPTDAEFFREIFPTDPSMFGDELER